MLALLLGVESEARLSKLLYEPGGFRDHERQRIRAKSTQLERWQSAILIAFRKLIPGAASSPSLIKSFPTPLIIATSTLQSDQEHDLAPIINVRNKLAHGQWAYPLNNEGDDVASELYLALKNETLLTLDLRRHLVTKMNAAVQDLVVSRPAFERDFDSHYTALAHASTRLRSVDYQRWRDLLHQKSERGRIKRATAEGGQV